MYKDRGVFRGVRKTDNGEYFRVIGKMRDRKAAGDVCHATTPRTADLPLAEPHMAQTYGAAGMLAVQEFRKAPLAEVVETDLALKPGALGQGLH